MSVARIYLNRNRLGILPLAAATAIVSGVRAAESSSKLATVVEMDRNKKRLPQGIPKSLAGFAESLNIIICLGPFAHSSMWCGVVCEAA